MRHEQYKKIQSSPLSPTQARSAYCSANWDNPRSRHAQDSKLHQTEPTSLRPYNTAESASRLKPQPELPPPPLLAHGIQKPSYRLLLRKSGAIEVFPHHQRKLVFAHAVLADNPAQTCVFDGRFGLRVRGCVSFALFFAGGLGAAGCEGRGGAEADALREDDAGVVVGEGARCGEFVDVAVSVEDVEREIRPWHL